MAKEEAAPAMGESELWGAIAAFERILEVMPTDRLALETLSDAYEKIGDITKAGEFLVRLADLILNEGDVHAAPPLIQKFKQLGLAQQQPELTQRLEGMLVAEQAAKDATSRATKAALRKGPDITREVSLAWDLMQAGELSSDDYSAVVHDLSESSSKRIDVPVSVLHALQDRGYKGYDKIVSYMSRASSVPIVPLSGFEVVPAAFNILPMDFMTQRGAVVFEVMGQDCLVAVLNPFDKDLQEDVKRTAARRCHFYLVSSSDYDLYLANINKALGGDKKSEKKSEKK